MRADVRMLGSLLGRVLRESGSAGLYEDVERLRVATIHAYTDDTPEAFASAAEIADSFTIDRADEVARAFTAYFHLVNLAEEHQRVRILRERDGRPDREDATDSVAAAFVRLAAEVGDDTALARLQALRFHPVFTAHPTEARRRAISTSIRRLAAFLEEHDASLRNGADQRRAERRMLEEIDTLWRTAPLRPEKPSPTDEVRAVMAVFDETLYTAIPHVYRRVDDALQGPAAGGRAPVVRPFVRVGSWVGGDRDGNPFVTASVTRKAAAIASEHVLLGLERTANRIGRGLTLDASTTPPSDALLGLWQRLKAADEDAATEIAKRSPNEPHRRIVLLIARKISATRARDADLAYTDPEELLADLRVVQDSLVQARAPQTGLRAPAAAAVAGRDVRLPPHRARGATALGRAREGARGAGRRRPALRARRGGARRLPRRRLPAEALRAPRRRALHRLVHAVRPGSCERAPAGSLRDGGCRCPGAGCRAAVRDLRRPPGRSAHPRGDRRAPGVRRAAGCDRAPAGGHARLLGFVQGRRSGGGEPRAVRRAGGDRRVGAGEPHRADPLPRPRRCARSRRRPRELRDPGPAAPLGRRALQAHRTGRGHLRPVRRPGDRDASHRSGRRRGADGFGAVDRRSQPRRGRPLRRRRRDDGHRIPRPLLRAGEGSGLRAVVRPGHPDGRGRTARARLAARAPRTVGRVARRPAGDPVGVRVDAGAHQPRGLVRSGHSPGRGGRRRHAPSGIPGVAPLPDDGRQRGDEPREGRSAHRAGTTSTWATAKTSPNS